MMAVARISVGTRPSEEADDRDDGRDPAGDDALRRVGARRRRLDSIRSRRRGRDGDRARREADLRANRDPAPRRPPPRRRRPACRHGNRRAGRPGHRRPRRSSPAGDPCGAWAFAAASSASRASRRALRAHRRRRTDRLGGVLVERAHESGVVVIELTGFEVARGPVAGVGAEARACCPVSDRPGLEVVGGVVVEDARDLAGGRLGPVREGHRPAGLVGGCRLRAQPSARRRPGVASSSPAAKLGVPEPRRRSPRIRTPSPLEGSRPGGALRRTRRRANRTRRFLPAIPPL